MDTIEVAARVVAWLDDGARVGVAWPVAFAGFSSRPPGELVAVADNGGEAGAIAGADVTSAVAADLRDALGSPTPPCRLRRLAVDDRAAAAAGLACGGTVTVALSHDTAVPRRFWEAVAAGHPAALVSRLPAEGGGVTTQVVVAAAGPTGEAVVDEAWPAPAGELLARGGTAGRLDTDDEGAVVALAVTPAPRLVVVGAGELATALCRQAELLGWRGEAYAGATEALDAIRGMAPGHGVVVLSHDPDVGVPALAAALASGAGYVGALGSRSTQANRRGRLLRAGVAEQAVDTIRGPAGLDLGGRDPREIALAICAEMVAVRAGRSGGPLRDRRGPVNG